MVVQGYGGKDGFAQTCVETETAEKRKGKKGVNNKVLRLEICMGKVGNSR